MNPAVRILREWHGYPVGAIIRPPGALRQILLDSKDQTGKAFGELVKAEPPASKQPPFDLGGKKKRG